MQTATTQQVRIPDIGDINDVTIVEVLVQPGDVIAADDSVITVESDKATLDVPTPVAGRIMSVDVSVGDTINEGMVMATIEVADTAEVTITPPPANNTGDEDADTSSDATVVPANANAIAAASASNHGEPSNAPTAVSITQTANDEQAAPPLPFASPGIRRFARELGVNVADVHGSGLRGRILKEDVHGFVNDAFTAGPGLTHGRPSTRPATCFSQVDVTRIKEFCDDLEVNSGEEIPLTAFVIKAVALALGQHPEFSGAEQGPVTIQLTCSGNDSLWDVVINDAGNEGVAEIAQQLASAQLDAEPDPATGPIFNIDWLDGARGIHFTPTIDATGTAALGLSGTAPSLVWIDGATREGKSLPLSLGWDDRVADTAEAAVFLDEIGSRLNDVRRFLI